MSERKYETPGDFKEILDVRPRQICKTFLEFTRRRQLLVFDRFLARIFGAMEEAMIMEDGFVLEFRVERSRTTRDIDLLVEEDETSTPERLG